VLQDRHIICKTVQNHTKGMDRDYRTGTHLFALHSGDTETGRRKIMTGQEAMDDNLAKQRAYVAAVRQGKPNGERLEVWKVIKKFI